MAASALAIHPITRFGDLIFTLQKNVAAFQVVADKNGGSRVGLCITLPRGSRIEVCGPGFSAGTVEVRSDGARYFMLWESIPKRPR